MCFTELTQTRLEKNFRMEGFQHHVLLVLAFLVGLSVSVVQRLYLETGDQKF